MDSLKCVKSSSVPRRFSPRFSRSIDQSISPNSPSDNIASPTPNPKTCDSQRRMSPRFHRDLVLDNVISPNSHSNDITSPTPKPKTCNSQKRMSPRLHKDLVLDNAISPTPKISRQSQLMSPRNPEPAPELRRLSPRLHPNTNDTPIPMTTPNIPMHRRLSPRLHNHNQNNSLFDKRSRNANDVFTDNKRIKHDPNPKPDFESSFVDGITQAQPSHQINMALQAWTKDQIRLCPNVAGRSGSARVKDTLRIFNSYYLQCVQEEEDRRKKIEIENNEKIKKSSKPKEEEERWKKIKNCSTSKEEVDKKTSRRPDLKALKKMREKKEILYPEKIIGHFPGIDAGYQFYSRAEMVAVGFHSHWLNGIDYIGKTAHKKEELKRYTLPIAVAVVMSGEYEDDLDNADDVIYTGEGGHDLLGSKLQHGDQALVRGNLALKNNKDQSIPIRVVRGRKNAGSYSGKIYSYDGLYKVVDTWADKGCRGHVVYKYRLKRIEGQPKLTTDQVKFVRGCPLKAFSELPGLVCSDISNGLEDNCIPVTNLVDDPPVCPPSFTYIKSIEVAESVKMPPNATGCSCRGSCTNPKTCACAMLNGAILNGPPDFPYVQRDGGRLAVPQDVVYECGPNCGCNPGCHNRVSQRKIKYRLEVYRTPDKGWAVRSWDFIPSGAPVCEYIGVVRQSVELDDIAGNESNDYIFEIDCLHTINEIEGRERRYGNLQMSSAINIPDIDKKALEDRSPEFCIDAGTRGNVARFINHSCDPNLFVQCILSAHHDLRLARIVLIAADNIAPMQELTYDYGYALNSVMGPDGKAKVLPCLCGTSICRKRLY